MGNRRVRPPPRHDRHELARSPVPVPALREDDGSQNGVVGNEPAELEFANLDANTGSHTDDSRGAPMDVARLSPSSPGPCPNPTAFWPDFLALGAATDPTVMELTDINPLDPADPTDPTGANSAELTPISSLLQDSFSMTGMALLPGITDGITGHARSPSPSPVRRPAQLEASLPTTLAPTRTMPRPLPRPLPLSPPPLKMPPQLLSCVDMGFLWHHYINRTALDVFCYDLDHPSSNLAHEQNAYFALLPRLAFGNDAVLHACLALSGSQYDRQQGTALFSRLVAKLLHKVDGYLETTLALALAQGDDMDNMSSSSTSTPRPPPAMMLTEDLLATILITQMLCACEAWSVTKSKWCDRVGSMQRLMQLALRRRGWRAVESQRTLMVFIFKGFVYLSIIVRLSLGSSHLHTSSQQRSRIGFVGLRDPMSTWQDIVGSSSSSRDQGSNGCGGGSPQSSVVDPVLAFSPRLIGPLQTLGVLLDHKLHKAAAANHAGGEEADDDDDDDDSSFARAADSLEEQLLAAYDQDMTLGTMGGCLDSAELLQCNMAFHVASHILFYARLKNMPSTSPVIRLKVRQVIQAIRTIPAASRTSSALAFPLFTAGCEAIEVADRDFILTKLQAMRSKCFSNIPRLAGTLHKVWEIRDLSPGIPWESWTAQVEVLLGECILF